MIYLEHSKRQSELLCFQCKTRVLADVKFFGTAVTVRDVWPITSNRFIKMRLLILFDPGNLRAQKSKPACFICHSPYKVRPHEYLVAAADRIFFLV